MLADHGARVIRVERPGTSGRFGDGGGDLRVQRQPMLRQLLTYAQIAMPARTRLHPRLNEAGFAQQTLILQPLQQALDLLERGADPFGPSPAGDPPIAMAVRLGWTRLLARLLAIGVHLDTRDSHGMSALHLAAALGREAMVKTLVANGASPDLLAADGQTPLGVALASGRRDIADWLDWRGWPLPHRALQASDVPAAAIVGDADAERVRRWVEHTSEPFEAVARPQG